MGGESSDAGQGSAGFGELLGILNCEIKAPGKQRGQFGGGTDRQEAVGATQPCSSRRQEALIILTKRGWSLLTQDPAKMVITGLIFDIEAQALAVAVPFGSDDRFDSGLGRLLGELDRAMEIAGIGQSDGGQIMLLSELDDRFDRER